MRYLPTCMHAVRAKHTPNHGGVACQLLSTDGNAHAMHMRWRAHSSHVFSLGHEGLEPRWACRELYMLGMVRMALCKSGRW